MLIETLTRPLVLAQAANDTTAGTAVANPADTLIRPTGNGVIDFNPDGGTAGVVPNELIFMPFGVGTATNTFLMAIFGWDKIIPAGTKDNPQYIATLLASFTCTLSTLAGIAGGSVNNNNLWCDTIALIKGGTAGFSQEIISPTGNIRASASVFTKGRELFQVKFWMNGSATSANTVWGAF